MRLVCTLYVCLAMAVTALPAAAQVPAAFEKPAAPGRLVDVGGGRRLHVVCKGSADGPSVIIEAGLSQYTAASTYGKAQEAIAAFARVCVYDRAGMGWSDAVAEGRTHRGMVEDLHRLLEAANIPSPYVLVGHSMGGLLVRQFVQAHRGDVVGVVLADATSESIFEPQASAARAGIIAQIEKGLTNGRPGVPVAPLPAGTAPEVAMSFTPAILAAVKDEYQAIDRAPADMRRRHGYGTLADLPLVVVRRGRTAQPPSVVDTLWRAEQEQLPGLSGNSILVVADHSGHVIPFDEPAVVADAVRRVISAWRRNGRVE